MTVLQELLSGPAPERIGWTLLHSLWEGAVVAGMAAAILASLRRRSPQARYLVCCGALVVMAALLPITFWRVPARAVAVVPPVIVQRVPDVEFFAPRPITVIPPAYIQSSSSAMASAAPQWRQRMIDQVRPALPWATAAWAVGVAIMCLRLLAGWLRVRRIARSSQPAGQEWQLRLHALARRTGLAPAVRLLESALVEVPAVIGAFKPVILLPVSALSGLSASQLDSILAHELAHVRRHDYLVNVLQCALEAVLFYHPAVWWISARIRQERELCCDDWAAEACGDRVGYARALLTLESLRAAPTQLAVAAAGGALLPRIRRLLGGPAAPARTRPRWKPGAAAVLALLLTAAPLYLIACGGTTDVAPEHAPAPPAATQRAAGTGDEVPGTDQTRETLAKVIPAVRFDNVALADAIEFLRDVGSADIYVDRAAVREAKIAWEKAPVSVSKDRITLAQALDATLRAAGGAKPLIFAPVGHVIYVSTETGVAAAADRLARQYAQATDLQDRKVLDKIVSELQFDNVPFSGVVDFLRDVTGANIFVDWVKLKQAGFDRRTPITLKVRTIPLGQALRLLMDAAGDGKVALDVFIRKGIIELTTAADPGGARSAGPGGLGAEVQCDVPEDGVIDFDTGTVLKLPAGVRWFGKDLGPRLKWTKATGGDAWAHAYGNPIDAPANPLNASRDLGGVFGSDMALKPVDAVAWDTLNGEAVLALLKGEEVLVDQQMQPMGKFPQTFVFKTRKGGAGLLQITRFGAKGLGVSLRFKMVKAQPAPALETTQPVSTTR